MHRTTRMAVMLGTLAWALPAMAEWKEPGDKRFTEDELKSYLATADEWAHENGKLMRKSRAQPAMRKSWRPWGNLIRSIRRACSGTI